MMFTLLSRRATAYCLKHCLLVVFFLFFGNVWMKSLNSISCFPLEQVLCGRGPHPPCHPGAGDQSFHWWTLEHGLVQNHRCTSHTLGRPAHTTTPTHTHMEPIGRVGCKMILWRRRTRKTEPSQSLFFPEKPPFSGIDVHTRNTSRQSSGSVWPQTH